MSAMNIVRREPTAPIHRVSAAQQRADRIRAHVAGLAEEYATAVLERDWEVLGYGSVEDWAAGQFGAQRFTAETRRQVAAILAAGGKTVREIAAATGVSHVTAVNDVKAALPPAETPSGGQKLTTSSPRQREERRREGTVHHPVPLSEPEPGLPEPLREQAAAPDPEPVPCPGCRDLEGQLEVARARIAELVARLSEAAESAAELAPHRAPQPPEQAADSSHAARRARPEPRARRVCGSIHAAKVELVVNGDVQAVAVDGEERADIWLCAEHRQLLAGRGVQVRPVPVSEWDVDRCRFRAQEGAA